MVQHLLVDGNVLPTHARSVRDERRDAVMTWQLEGAAQGGTAKTYKRRTRRAHGGNLKTGYRCISERARILRVLLIEAVWLNMLYASADKKLSTVRMRKCQEEAESETTAMRSPAAAVAQSNVKRARPAAIASAPPVSQRKLLLILLFLCIAHGVVLGIMTAIPLLLLQHGISYKQHVKFSLAFWPYCLRLLWAPVINSSLKTLFAGRTDLMPPITRCTVTLIMMRIVQSIENWLNCYEDLPTLVDTGASFYFLICLLASALDIFVDAALLQCAHARYANFGKRFGVLLGYACSYAGIMAYQSVPPKEIAALYVACNWRQLMRTWGITIYIGITLSDYFKCQLRDEEPNDDESGGAKLFPDVIGRPKLMPAKLPENAQAHETILALMESYRVLMQVIHKSTFQELKITFVTVRFSLISLESLASLNWVRYELLKNHVALAKVFLQPLHLAVPLYLRHWLVNKNAPTMDSYLQAVPKRVCFAAAIGLITYYISQALVRARVSTRSFYRTMLSKFLHYQLIMNCMCLTLGIFAGNLLSIATCNSFGQFVSGYLNADTCSEQHTRTWLETVVQAVGIDSCNIYQTCSNCTLHICNDELFGGYHVEFLTCLLFVIVWLYFRLAHARKLTECGSACASA